MVKIGVLPMRAQVNILHLGHKELIETAIKENDFVLVLLGVSDKKLTERNPLPFEARKHLFTEYSEKCFCIPMDDMPSDKDWSMGVDAIIYNFLQTYTTKKATIYTGRGGVKDQYSGIHDIVEVPTVGSFSASDIRNQISTVVKDSKDWREGVIWASKNKYLVPYHTVDIAMFSMDMEKLLLCSKKNTEGKLLIGGFVDNNDTLESACQREVMEETGIANIFNLRYIKSFHVEDWRYVNESENVLTSLFVCTGDISKARPMDDIDSVHICNVNDIDIDDICEPHRNLVQEVIKNVKK